MSLDLDISVDQEFLNPKKMDINLDYQHTQTQIQMEEKMEDLFNNLKEYSEYHILDIFETLSVEKLINLFYPDIHRIY